MTDGHHAGFTVKRLGSRYYVELKIDGKVFMTSSMFRTRALAVNERDEMRAALIEAAKGNAS